MDYGKCTPHKFPGWNNQGNQERAATAVYSRIWQASLQNTPELKHFFSNGGNSNIDFITLCHST
jgi:hypothetical protein